MIRSDVRAVLNASALLEISEYDFFRLAYFRWHGEIADERAMEGQFAAYMFREVVPLWVTSFARLVEQQHGQGRLDRRALGVTELRQSRQMVYRGILAIAAIVVVMTVLIVLAESAAQFISQEDRCIFPPCY
jgi:hypothetical protein